MYLCCTFATLLSDSYCTAVRILLHGCYIPAATGCAQHIPQCVSDMLVLPGYTQVRKPQPSITWQLSCLHH